MRMRLGAAVAVLLTAYFAAPGGGIAKGFRVEKFDIKGDGGTDYVDVDTTTGRVFVARGTT